MFDQIKDKIKKVGSTFLKEAKQEVKRMDSKDVVLTTTCGTPFVLYKGVKILINTITSPNESDASKVLTALYNEYIMGNRTEENTINEIKKALNNDYGRISCLGNFFLAVISLNKALKEETDKKARFYNDAMTYFDKALNAEDHSVLTALSRQNDLEAEDYSELIALFRQNDLEFEFNDKQITADTVSHFIHYERGNIFEFMGEIGKARAEYICVMKSCNYAYKKYAKDKYHQITNQLKTEFTNIPRGERQYLLFAQNIDKIAGVYDKYNIIRWIFPIDDCPLGLTFSTITPEANRLYTLHPRCNNLYIPFDKIEEYLFNEKIKEFSFLCRCVGATKITYETVKGSKVTESHLRDINAGLEGGYKIAKGKIDTKYGKENRSNNENATQTRLEWKFSPLKNPASVPSELLWKDDPNEQELINMFSQGGLEAREWIFNSKSLSDNFKSIKFDVKASFEYMMVNVGTCFNQESDTTFSQQEEIEWKLFVSFEPEDLGLINRIKMWFKRLFGIK